MRKLFGGKGGAILDASSNGDIVALEKIFGIKRDDDDMKVSKQHNLEVVNDAGSTPLILASMNGHKDIVDLLLELGADVNHADASGNVPLHMAAWYGKADIVSTLIDAGANINSLSSTGETAVHYASQFGKPFVLLKLLQAGADPAMTNTKGEIGLELAARFNHKESFSILMDTVAINSLPVARCLFEATKIGRKEIVEVILDHGVDPNVRDESGNVSLHDAAQFFRNDVAQILIDFGANPTLKNQDHISPLDVVTELHRKKSNPLYDLFINAGGPPKRKAQQALVTKARGLSVKELASERKKQEMNASQVDVSAAVVMEFVEPPLGHPGRIGHQGNTPPGKCPKLHNKIRWTKNDKKHCSSFDPQNPCTNAIDGKSSTYWRILSGRDNYMVLDMIEVMTITGVVMYTYGNEQSVCDFKLETAESLDGPWNHTGQIYNTKMLGSEDIEDYPVAQEFDIDLTSRFFRLVVINNFGSMSTVCHQVEFRGYDNSIHPWLGTLGLESYYSSLINAGGNTMCDMWRLDDNVVSMCIVDPSLLAKFTAAVRELKGEPLQMLRWRTAPTNMAKSGVVLPTFIVEGTPGCNEEIYCFGHGGAIIGGEFAKKLTPKGEHPSFAIFDDITLDPPGNYVLEVTSVLAPGVILVRQNDPIVVSLAHQSVEALDATFDELDGLLNMDI